MKRLYLIFLFYLGSCTNLTTEDTRLFIGNWLEETPNSSFIQGISLKPDGTAASIGMATLKYESWNINGDTLILSGKSIGNHQTISFSDKWQIIEINKNTMKLEDSNGYQINYHRTETPKHL